MLSEVYDVPAERATLMRYMYYCKNYNNCLIRIPVMKFSGLLSFHVLCIAAVSADIDNNLSQYLRLKF